jgi:predicted nucleic acid-binding protein
MAILIDTSALLAYVSVKDKNHTITIKTMKNLGQENRVVTSAVVSELFYMAVVKLIMLRQLLFSR